MKGFRAVTRKAKPVNSGEAPRGVRSRQLVRGAGNHWDLRKPKISKKTIKQISVVLVMVAVMTVVCVIATVASVEGAGLFLVGSFFGLIGVHAVLFGIERIYNCELLFRNECVLTVWISVGLLVVLMGLR